MKKLVYLLVLSLCVNGVAGALSAWPQSASAESKTEEKAEKSSAKKDKKQKTDGEKSDKETKSKKKTTGKEKKTKVEKEKEYTLDLSENSQVTLSDILKYAKLDIKLKDVKSIELEDKEDKKTIKWEPDEENEGDYIFTVRKDFKELRLRLVTKKSSRLLVLKNGVKAKKKDDDKTGAKAASDKASEKKADDADPQEKPTKEKAKEPADEPQEAPAKENADAASEKEREEIRLEADVEIEKEPAEEKQDVSDIEVNAEPEEAPEKEAEPQPEVAPEAEVKPEPEEAHVEEAPAEEAKPQPEEAPAEEAGEPEGGDAQEQTEVETEKESLEAQTSPETEAPTESEAGEAEEATAETVRASDEASEATAETAESTEDAASAAEVQQEPAAPVTEAGEGQGGAEEAPGATPENQGTTTEAQGENPEAQTATPESQGENPEAPGATPESQGENPETLDTATEPQGENPEVQGESAEAQAEDQTDTEDQPGTEAPQTEPVGEGQAPATDGDGAAEDTQPEGATIPETSEAWFKRGAELFWGTLEEIAGRLTGGETVYIQSDRLMLIRQAPLQVLSTVVLLPDGEVFQGDYRVCLSTDNPALVAQPAIIGPEQLAQLGVEAADLYLWVIQQEEQAPGEEGGDEEKPVLTVTATGLEPEGWTRTQPQFTLSGIPEGKAWTYAAIIYDERIVPIAANVYAPEQEGVYTLRFAMLDDIGDIMANSDQYTLQLDWTAPEVTVEADEETSYTLDISATDAVSGLDAVTVDGGETWHSIEDGEYTVTMEAETTFKAGDIRVRDVAGNVFKSEGDYTVSEVEGEEGDEEGEEEGDEGGEIGGGGGGGSDGSGKAALPHSSGDGDEGTDYDALALDLPDEPMDQLMVGGELMDLTLMLTAAQEPGAPVGKNQPFTARLRHWEDAADDDAPNTLMLEACIDGDLGDAFTYEWRFNGEVYRLLANSGIKYVALKVWDAVAAFPTEGFTGGTRYTELKMQGVSTRRFEYTLAMKLNLDPSHVSAMTDSDYSQECDLSIHTDVEGKNYELSNSPQSMMYFYNVFVGPEDMLDQPFGEYDANA